MQRLDFKKGHKKTMWITLLDDKVDDDASMYLETHIMCPTFSVSIDLTKLDVGDRIAVMSVAIVGHSWADLPTNKLNGLHKLPP